MSVTKGSMQSVGMAGWWVDSADAGDAVFPAEATVWHDTGVYGPNGNDFTPSMVGSDIPNLEPANIKDGVIIDDVEGTYSGLPPAPPNPNAALGDVASVNIAFLETLRTANINSTEGDEVEWFDTVVPKKKTNQFPRGVLTNVSGGEPGRVFGEKNVERWWLQLSIYASFAQGDFTEVRRLWREAVNALEHSTYDMNPDKLIFILRRSADPRQDVDDSEENSIVSLSGDFILEVHRGSA